MGNITVIIRSFVFVIPHLIFVVGFLCYFHSSTPASLCDYAMVNRNKIYEFIFNVFLLDKEEHCVTALEWGQEGKTEDQDDQQGDEWLRTKDEQLGGSHGRLLEL